MSKYKPDLSIESACHEAIMAVLMNYRNHALTALTHILTHSRTLRILRSLSYGSHMRYKTSGQVSQMVVKNESKQSGLRRSRDRTFKLKYNGEYEAQ